MDVDVLAERILLDLKNTFKKDPLIDEFDVVPVHESNSNTCPVIHVEHKVALEDWCVKHVYVYAYSKFFTWRKKPYKIDPDCLLTWTSAILLINPETETVWNSRKELVCQNVLLPENELKFSELVLSRKPKSSPVYAHRKWVLLELRKGDSCTPCTLQSAVEHELHLCTRFANLYPNNYYAWCHRTWVVKELAATCIKTVLDELSRTEKWASTHISDHCGLHYRQFLLSCLSGNPTAPCPLHAMNNNETCSLKHHFPETLFKEIVFLGSLQAVYPGHEALWYHRRYLLHEFDKICRHEEAASETVQCKRHKLECDDAQRWSARDSKRMCSKEKDMEMMVWGVDREEAFLREAFNASKDGHWERTLAERHLKWLVNALSWPPLLLLS